MHIDIFHRSYFLVVVIIVVLGAWIAQEAQSERSQARPEYTIQLPKQPFQV